MRTATPSSTAALLVVTTFMPVRNASRAAAELYRRALRLAAEQSIRLGEAYAKIGLAAGS